MIKINQFGLSRNIPEPVRREVRSAAGFGCVVCGLAICQYEHVDPEFKDASKHEASKIAFLCATCHDRVTRGVWSKQKIKAAMRSPKCRQVGFTFDAFDIQGQPDVFLGDIRFVRSRDVLTIDGKRVIGIAEPEQNGGPFRLSATFVSHDGTELLRIVDNVWFASTNKWDIETKGTRIIIRHASGSIPLVLRAMPPSGVVIERLALLHNGCKIIIDDHSTSISFDGEVKPAFVVADDGLTIKDAGLSIDRGCIDVG